MAMRATLLCLALLFAARSSPAPEAVQSAAPALRVALAKQPFSPTGLSKGPDTMAGGGIQQTLAAMGVSIRIDEARLTPEQQPEYGGWKRLGYALGNFADIVTRNERDGYFTVGLYATCPSMPGMVAGLQRSGPDGRPLRVGMLWLDAHPDFNTPETTRSGSLGGMPVAVATGRALHNLRRDARLDPPLSDDLVVMGGVRLTDPLEQDLLDASRIRQLSVDDLRNMTPAVFAELDRLNRIADKLYVHIDMDVLDPREVMAHGNKVPGGPSSEELARLFEQIFKRYPKASAIGFATIPSTDEGGLSIAAVNRMIAAAVRGVQARGSQVPAAQLSNDVTAEDLRVIDAALNHKARTALNLGKKILLNEQTLRACGEGRVSLSCVPIDPRSFELTRRKLSEPTAAKLIALAERNAESRTLPSAPAEDVVLTTYDRLAEMRRLGTVHASTSLPVYFPDNTAVVYLNVGCGGRCGEGNFILLRRGPKGWKVQRAAKTWIS